MTDIRWLPFFGVVLLAYAIPGPDFAVVARAAANSRSAGWRAGLGAQAGLCVHMVSAVIGVSLLISRLPMALSAVRVAGGLYLIWLGIVALRDSVASSSAATDMRWFRMGLTTNLLNPKAILFFVAILPQFVDPDGSLPLQIGILGIIDVAIGLAVWAVVTAAVDRMADRSATSKLWNRAVGVLFIGIGVAFLGNAT
ncbi:LysE family translocator [Rhodococcus sp. IEGM 1401]|uniref:LysE family translocator n=1 Tax=unclassified Rhodococcus (in: high G+C Gram-positive bacteria) TaxID=192944 RepID=UPI0022B41978|nr:MULTISPECIES: LysE family translocator [unclassified Rhodococcus (in: high G+C Gram-positive bacteria)]MCZ4560851.1 LysE family translocator [Rhodococcus sp. IEGM 1401]MDI9920991.1 LysE family translocator [Rhodococcus sp. IEGM 1372]MDV8033408.1 LysE family translocator [Rhodococcus sp. IEGM 1414]